MEMNVEKTKVMKISGQLSPVQIMVDHKQPGNVEYLNYCNSIITHDATKYAREIKSMTAIPRAAFNKKKTSPPNWT
jgi:hypothetical protein